MRRILIALVSFLLGILFATTVLHAGVFRAKKITQDFDKVVPVAMRASTKIAAELQKQDAAKIVEEKPVEEPTKEVIK